MTIPFGEPEPSDALLSKSVTSTRLRAWLTSEPKLMIDVIGLRSSSLDMEQHCLGLGW